MEINGTLVWYYHICKREVWLMSHYIVPDQQNENIDLGRFLHEEAYKRNSKEIVFGNVRFDVLLDKKNQLIIGETKKSSSFTDASRWQLLYYLNVLKKAGVNASGVLLYPKEKKRIEVELTEENILQLGAIEEEISALVKAEKPLKPVKCKYCGKCAYEEYCWS